MDASEVIIFLDDDTAPIAHVQAPVHFDLDTTKLVDGTHQLRVVSKDTTGKEGIRIITFEVRNGPSITVEGLKENGIVDGVVPIMVNAYSKGNSEKFYITGSESPQTIPTWIWIIIIFFTGWGIYYLISYLSFKP